MDIYQALSNDHNALKPLLDRLVETSEKNESTHYLLDQIRDALIPHSRAEEAVFYNCLRDLTDSSDIIGHAYREHLEAEAVLRTLRGLEKINVEWTAAAKKLRDDINHHIQEEEGRVFAEARQILMPEEAEQMAVAFKALKAKAKTQSDFQNTLAMVANMMPVRFQKSVNDARAPRSA